MKFSDFSRHLQKIESTTKRLEMTSLLVRLMREASISEIDKVVYLSLGQLAPLYADKDFGLAEKMLIRAIALSFDVKEARVRRLYKEGGDLGEVAQKLSGEKKHPQKDLSVTEAFKLLHEIADESGEGSQERKLGLVATLLRCVDQLSARYLVRILLRTLRLGFSDKTVLDALSVFVRGDKSARDQIEAAYNVRPDVGELAKNIKTHALSGIAHVKPRIRTPILPALCQRLPSAEEIIEKMCRPSGRASSIEGSGNHVAVEPKWDGQRIQAHLSLNPNEKLKMKNEKLADVKLFTRSLENVTDMFPDLVAALKAINNQQSTINNCILDGEVVAVEQKTGRMLPFQTMITRKRKYGIQEKILTVPIRYMVFDVLLLNNHSLIDEPFSRRRDILEHLLSSTHQKPSSLISLAPQIVTEDPQPIRAFLHDQQKAGLEGLVAKQVASPYTPGRTGFSWVKLKWEGEAKSGGLLDTIDCVVMGVYAGRGKRAGFGVGAFLVGIYSPSNPSNPSGPSFLTISKIGTGLTDEQWRELKVKEQGLKTKGQPKEYEVPKELVPDTWLRPELVVEIQADNITKSPLHSAGYALRFPRLVRYRSDKQTDQSTSIDEVKKLYTMQENH